jgi:hypothetical protein
MAEGGAEFGDVERQPLLRNTDDRDDGDAAAGGNETTGFEPGASSTPAPRQTTMNRPGEPSFVDLPDVPGLSTTTFAETELLKEFPDFDKNKIKYKLDEKNGRLKVGIAKADKPYYDLITKIAGKDEYRINPKIPKEIVNALGKSRRGTLEEEIKRLTDGINDNKAVAEDSSVSEAERNNARERAKRQIEKRTDLARQLDQLKKGNYSLPSESIELEDFQKNDEVRQEREQEIQCEIEEQVEIINDKNRPSVEIDVPRKI